jgi:hypothetical protein
MSACAENIAKKAKNLMALTLSKCDFLISLFMRNIPSFQFEAGSLQSAKEKKILPVQNIYFRKAIYLGSNNRFPCPQNTHPKQFAR